MNELRDLLAACFIDTDGTPQQYADAVLAVLAPILAAARWAWSTPDDPTPAPVIDMNLRGALLAWQPPEPTS